MSKQRSGTRMNVMSKKNSRLYNFFRADNFLQSFLEIIENVFFYEKNPTDIFNDEKKK